MSEPIREPMMIHAMRRWPQGEVRFIPGGGIGMSGTSTVGFLREFDEYIAASTGIAYDDGFFNGRKAQADG